MQAKKHETPDQTSGAIDLMYFPPARHPSGPLASEIRCHEPIASVVALKQECGLGYVCITPCKRWDCDRRIYCADMQLDDVLRYTSPYPQHFIGIGGYNPLEIADSIHQTEIGIRHHGFKGVYVHPGSFGISLSDRRMYPLYVKALEWKVPAIIDVRKTAGDEHCARIADLAQIASDFPDLSFVIAQPYWTVDEMSRLADDVANIFYCFDSAALLCGDTLKFVNSDSGQSRCMWGSNGQRWDQVLGKLDHIPFPNAKALFRDNAMHVFHLSHLRKRAAKPYHETEPGPVRIVAE